MTGSHPDDPRQHGLADRVSRRLALAQAGRGGLAASTLAALGLASAPAALAQDDACDCERAGGSPTDCGCHMPDPIVPPATLASLPASDPDSAGLLRYLTDYDRGLWLDSGAGWVGLRGHVFDVRAFGATGDGETDDWPAFTAALAAMASWLADDSTAPDAHTLLVPPGAYRLAQSLIIDRAVRIAGTGGGGRYADAVLRFDAGLTGIVLEAARPGLTGGDPGRRADGAILERLRIEAAAGGGGAPVQSGEIAPSVPQHGVLLRTRAAALHCAVIGFAGDGIRVEVPSGVSGGAAAGWHVEACEVAGCGGHGLAASRASGGVCALLTAGDNRRWGIADDAETGNTYLACRAVGNQRGAFTSTGDSNRSLFLGCSSAAGQPRSVFGATTVVAGGDHGAGFAGGNAWTADGSRMHLQAQAPDVEPALRTAPTLALGGAEGQTQPHLLVTDTGDERLAELDAAGRLFVGPREPATGPSETGEPTGPVADPPLLNLVHPANGRAGIRWIVPAETGGFVAQVQAFVEAPGPDAPATAVGSRLTFQTAAAGRAVDTLTLRDGRVGLGTTAPAPAAILDLASTSHGFLPPRLSTEQRDAISTPPEGLTVYNATSRRLNVFDGTAWQDWSLPPRLSTEQRDAIASPPEGLTIFNVTTKRLNFFDSIAWQELAIVESDEESEETGG